MTQSPFRARSADVHVSRSSGVVPVGPVVLLSPSLLGRPGGPVGLPDASAVDGPAAGAMDRSSLSQFVVPWRSITPFDTVPLHQIPDGTTSTCREASANVKTVAPRNARPGDGGPPHEGAPEGSGSRFVASSNRLAADDCNIDERMSLRTAGGSRNRSAPRHRCTRISGPVWPRSGSACRPVRRPGDCGPWKYPNDQGTDTARDRQRHATPKRWRLWRS